MRIASLQSQHGPFLGVRRGDGYVDANAALPDLPRDLGAVLRAGLLERLTDVEGPLVRDVTYRPLVSDPGKILCLGVNYIDHAKEASLQKPDYPVVFGRFTTSFVGHEVPLVRPRLSTHFDYEAELLVVIGRRGRAIPRERALEHVAGYALLNDGTIRDYQKRTSQWTVGKNFDRTGAMGPDLVTPDELPPGARGLRIRGRLNGETMQEANTTDMVFDVVSAIALLSEAMTLDPGDVIAMGTPGGVGFVREPPVFLKPGDVFEVEVDGVGTLRNSIIDEA
ncbi:fumarylacetoacetate hydrolase family protein [Chondromyces crocatus]|uniref:5-oxopent-3-ene-1,2,5-tricarboxylate decarboxylase n=1 Tax=Chondromyces crocatus TaxID=52 RepID=A0A0K1EPL1_CHOCO|nr:fumarylacetoacetate hydrolase family protein [Chondromyces crocatus]AKT42860.1 5-oxopent-3-ene-1,2,5-tricarboxylate decarboxylase [Chondromyces crocatus]